MTSLSRIRICHYFLVLFSFGSMGLSISTNAIAADKFAADTLYFHLGLKFDAGLRKDRVKVANEMLTDFREFTNLLPVQRPSELDWIKAEQAAIRRIPGSEAANQRAMGLDRSVESQHMALANLAKAVVDALECVANLGVSLGREMFCWSVASFNISDSSWDDGIPILIQFERLPKDLKKLNRMIASAESEHWILYHRAARSIQEFIVIPYLGGRIQ